MLFEASILKSFTEFPFPYTQINNILFLQDHRATNSKNRNYISFRNREHLFPGFNWLNKRFCLNIEVRRKYTQTILIQALKLTKHNSQHLNYKIFQPLRSHCLLDVNLVIRSLITKSYIGIRLFTRFYITANYLLLKLPT